MTHHLPQTRKRGHGLERAKNAKGPERRDASPPHYEGDHAGSDGDEVEYVPAVPEIGGPLREETDGGHLDGHFEKEDGEADVLDDCEDEVRCGIHAPRLVCRRGGGESVRGGEKRPA